MRIESDRPRTYVAKKRFGRTFHTSVKPAFTAEIKEPWVVAFTPGGGAPSHARFDKLQSCSSSKSAFVKYFSGTATYRQNLKIGNSFLRMGGRHILEVGTVEVTERVRLNGHEFGVPWRAPYQIDLTGLLHKGSNQLEISVTNLWPNRMIGDERLKEAGDRYENGTLKTWPKWVEEGKSSPTGRFTFTSWKLWQKDDPLLPSVLIGQVQIMTVSLMRLQ